MGTVNNRYAKVLGVGNFSRNTGAAYNTYFSTPNAALITANTFTFFQVFQSPGVPGYRYMLNSWYPGVGGWGIYESAGSLYPSVYTTGPTVVQSAIDYRSYGGYNAPYICICRVKPDAGQLRLTTWLNGVQAGNVAGGATGTYLTSGAVSTLVGTLVSAANAQSFGLIYADCGMMNNYDAEASFVSATYGNGVAGLTAMWWEDLRQGRYLTWPRAAVANSDWYWAGKDVFQPLGNARTTWTDRHSSVAMTRANNAQGASFAPRLY